MVVGRGHHGRWNGWRGGGVVGSGGSVRREYGIVGICERALIIDVDVFSRFLFVFVVPKVQADFGGAHFLQWWERRTTITTDIDSRVYGVAGLVGVGKCVVGLRCWSGSDWLGRFLGTLICGWGG